MSLLVADRVQETCAAPGTGVVTLLGAVTQYQSFSAGIGANNTTYYTIADQTGSNWEVGLGTIGATGLTLTRTTVLASSNAGSIVNFSVGTQNIWCDYPAGKAVYGTGTTLVAPTGTLLPVANGGTNLGGATPYTANGVMYASSTSALATSSALTFNGTTLNSATLALTSTSAGALVDIATITNASNTTNTETGIFFAPTTTTGNIRGARISAYQVTGNNDIAIKIYTGNGATISAGTIHWPAGGVSIGNTTDPGATNLSVTGSTTSASFIPSSATVPTNGLYLPAANNVGIATNSGERMRIDSSGNLGLGVTPSAWNSLFKAIQVGAIASFGYDNSFGQTVVTNNAYGTGSAAYTYLNATSLQAARYEQKLGTHAWFTAPSGTAGNAITFTQAMTLFASGGLSLGNITDAGAGNLSVTGSVTGTSLVSSGSLSAVSNAVGSVTAKTGGLTAVTAVAGSLTLATGGVTLASQVMASGSVWRVTAYGTYVAASSANARTLTMACYWGATKLTSVTTGNVLSAVAQTTAWKVELEISGSNATAAWCTGLLSAQVTSATIPLNYAATAASVTGLTTTSTLDFQVGQTGTATATDTINVHSVTLERIK